MSTPIHEQHAAAYRAREVPPPASLGHGITALPIPLAGSALRSVMIYTIETSAGLVLVDAGYRHRSCWDGTVEALAAVGQRVEDVVAVLLTHNHPDHVGLADQIRQVSGARVVMHRRDDFATQHPERGPFLSQLATALSQTGAPEDVAMEMYAAAVSIAVHDEDLVLDQVLEEPDTSLVFGDTEIRALHLPGHTYGHTCYLHPDGVLLTGDTLMPEGPTQLAIAAQPGDNPAGDLLASLQRIASIDPDLAGPAHQYPYSDVTRRALQLHDFHAREVEAVATLAERHDTAWEIAPHLTWAKPWAELGLGTQRFALIHTLGLLRAVRPD